MTFDFHSQAGTWWSPHVSCRPRPQHSPPRPPHPPRGPADAGPPPPLVTLLVPLCSRERNRPCELRLLTGKLTAVGEPGFEPRNARSVAGGGEVLEEASWGGSQASVGVDSGAARVGRGWWPGWGAAGCVRQTLDARVRPGLQASAGRRGCRARTLQPPSSRPAFNSFVPRQLPAS